MVVGFDPSAILSAVLLAMEEPDPRAVADVAVIDLLAVPIVVQPELEGLDPQVGPSIVVQVVGPLESGSSAAAVAVAVDS